MGGERGGVGGEGGLGLMSSSEKNMKFIFWAWLEVWGTYDMLTVGCSFGGRCCCSACFAMLTPNSSITRRT